MEANKTMGRKNKRRWNILFSVLNQRLLGLNMLWGGWNWAKRRVHWCHWRCAGPNFRKMCKGILRWPNKLLTVPPSMSSFLEVAGKKPNYNGMDAGLIGRYEVQVEKIALPSDPPHIIPVLSILPPAIKQKYEQESNIVTKDSASWSLMRECRPRLGMTSSEYVKVLRKLSRLGMVTMLPIKEVRVINGLHCVTKENGKQRLIFDGRPVNFVLEQPEKVELPDFSLLAEWEVREGESIRFGKIDLDNFYHRMGVPSWLVPFLGLPTVDAALLGEPSGIVSPACLTLPMGLSHSVLLAQYAHLYLLRDISVAPTLNKAVGKEAEGWCLLYIDDIILAEKRDNAILAEIAVNKVISECLDCYQKTGLVVNTKKMVWAAPEILGLGCTLSEEKCGIYPKADRLITMVGATKFLLQSEAVTPKSVECVLGHWVWFILLYRPLYSILFHIYRWLQETGNMSRRTLWTSVERELQLIILFMDICHLSWSRKSCTSVLAMDASLKGAGACEYQWEKGDNRGDLEGVIPSKNSELWKGILNQKWQRVEHINVLEMRALILSLLPRVKLMKHCGTKWAILSDSGVVVGAGNRLDVSTLRQFTIGLAPATIRLYATAIIKFVEEVKSVRFNDLDSQLLEYVQSSPPLAQRSVIERISCAFQHFFPETTGGLPRLRRFAHQLRRQYRGLTKPPMIWDVLLLVVSQLTAMGRHMTALGALLQFDCFLRPAELSGVLVKHIAFPGGSLLGSRMCRTLVLLPKTKTGPLQSVRVESKLVEKLLRKVTRRFAPETALFPSVTVFRKRLSQVLQALKLGHIGYTPHSVRHGAATTALINQGEEALPAIMFRGRWQSAAGKSYLQMGAAALLFAEIPRDLLLQAARVEKELPRLFKHVQWTPGS